METTTFPIPQGVVLDSARFTMELSDKQYTNLEELDEDGHLGSEEFFRIVEGCGEDRVFDVTWGGFYGSIILFSCSPKDLQKVCDTITKALKSKTGAA